MPENASRLVAALFDQFEDEHQVADWGGDELFTRMPRSRAVDDAPPPRFRRAPALPDAPQERPSPPSPAQPSGARDRRRAVSADTAMRERAERLGLSVVVDDRSARIDDAVYRFDASGSLVEPPAGARRSKVITGHPGGAPRPLPTIAARRRAARTPAEWIGPRPERLVGWAFVLGLVLILIAVSTA